MSPIELVSIVVAAVAVVVAAVAVMRAGRAALGAPAAVDEQTLASYLERTNAEVASLKTQQAADAASTRASLDAAARSIEQAGNRVDGMRRDVTSQLAASAQATTQHLQGLSQTTAEQLRLIRQDTNRQLDEMRATVDDRLTKTLNDRLSSSFKQINESLEAVYRGLGDMKSLAAGVGDLKKTLSNVKTRGILGEVQLGAILSEVLAPAQYAENVATKPGSADRVEFAVKLPVEEGEPVWLPIDAKFPGDTYAQLRDALDSGDREAIVVARKQLETRIKAEARDISTKYVSVPATTNFGIMFLPFEGLYAEVVSMPGLIESLQRDWHVNVAGPSTMAALLSSLEMAYQTFNLQRRTDEVLRVLQAVKAELPKYQAELRRAKQQIDLAGRTVDGIITTRTNVMERKLKDISLNEDETPTLDGEE
ncbi:DNA recombination protein RmuC [Parolsenella catena]|uniref:DNA recombination protein RmuC n=1 Tax=Parolsenella catena TaxID=2003188 RepID=UPI00319E0065